MTLLGLPPDLLFNMGWDQAKTTVSQRIYNTERQLDILKVPSFPISEEQRYITCPAPYLNNVEAFKHCRAFTLARCHCLPSAVLEGCFKKIPYKDYALVDLSGPNLLNTFFFIAHFTETSETPI